MIVCKCSVAGFDFDDSSVSVEGGSSLDAFVALMFSFFSASSTISTAAVLDLVWGSCPCYFRSLY